MQCVLHRHRSTSTRTDNDRRIYYSERVNRSRQFSVVRVLLTTYPESPAVFRQRFSFGAAGAEPDLVETVITTKAVTQIPVSGGALLAMGLCIALVGRWRLRQT